MTDITPGYDFDVNEVPTAETLLLQATGLQITEVGIDSLDSAVVGIKSGDASAVTDSLRVGDTVGTMWVSPFGDIWVQEASGPVILNRIMGGWETRRVFVTSDSSFPNHIHPGSVVQQTSSSPGNSAFYDTSREEGSTRTTSVAVLKNSDGGSYLDSRNGFHFGVTQGETTASAYHRVLHRGLTIYRDRDVHSLLYNTLSELQNGYRLKAPTGLSADKMMGTEFFQVTTQWKKFAACMMPGNGSSIVSNASGNHEWKTEWMMWAFGSWSWMNKT